MASREDVMEGAAALADAGMRRRLPLIDAARGIAILAMVVYHIAWDLFVLGFVALDITNEPGWVAFQRSIVSAFLLLVGVSLVLAHGDGIRWRPFWRRFAMIVGAALLTTAGTFVVFPIYFVYFGILHAIALFSLVGLAFVRVPLWAVLLGIAVVMLPPAFFTDPAMSAKPLSWIGFWPYPPMTTDIVPVFPWFGLVLIGILLTRGLRRTRAWAVLERPRPAGPAVRGFAFLGRWSLLIYLLHQPLLYGGLSLIAPKGPDPVAFARSCEQTCVGGGNDAPYCSRYCLCALEEVERLSLWDEIASDPQGQAVTEMRRLCTDAAR